MAEKSRSLSDPRGILIALGILLSLGLGGKAALRFLAAQATGVRSPAAGKSLTDAQKAELLSEMFRVVLGREPSRAAELYSGLLSSLVQGASLEGIYNGLVHSAEYREIERQAEPAPGSAVAVFAQELEWLESQLIKRTQWGPDAGRPLGVIDPALPIAQSPGPPQREYSEIFKGASVPTLRRVLGDSALRVLAERSSDARSRADWYAGMAARLASSKVDFALPLRNRPDREFHRDWASAASQDLLTWEVLNRYHRLLNQLVSKSPERSAPRS